MTVQGASEPEREAEAWYRRSGDDALTSCRSRSTGLTEQEAVSRLATDGPNQLKQSKAVSPFHILAEQFKSIIIWILIAAGAISAVLGEALDALAIGTIVVLNAAIGFYQEFNADRAITLLKSMVAPRAKVLRAGALLEISAANVVVGDVLALEAGDLVAADARLLTTAAFKCVESALTGEAEAVLKQSGWVAKEKVAIGDRLNLVFMGTSVAAGTAHAVVVATAMNTELGRIAHLIGEAGADNGTPLQRKLNAFGHVLVWVALGIVALLFCLGLLRGEKLLQLTLTSISLAVAAVPEGLPAVVTVALAVGVSRMVRRGALVRKLAAVETLGSTNVICTDKTGTLTVGQMTVRALHVASTDYEVTGEGYGPVGEVLFEGKKAAAPHLAPLLELASVLLGCNNARLVQEAGAWKVVGDPTEGALLAVGLKAGGDRNRIEADTPKQSELPFDSDRKRSAVIRRLVDGNLRVLINGAPGPLLKCCTHIYSSAGVRALTDEDRAQVLGQTSAMAKKGLRVLASARRDLNEPSAAELTADAVERDLVFVGLTGMYDPPRPEGKEAVERCHAAGVRVVMITGDHPDTATAIAQEVGIGSVVVTGAELDEISDVELHQRATGVAVYARVTAQHKLRIVRALKANGAVVAMTGDGVNDAPAIKGADIGIAMGKSGTEVTKQAADMIITDDNFATIVAAVEEGRGIYDNIRKTLQYLLAGNTGELLLMTVCVVVGLPAPLLPIHLLWINLVTDGLPALCLATDAIDRDVMKHGPRARSQGIADAGFLRTMLLTGVLTGGVAFAAYFHALRTETPATARTAAFSVLVFAELLRALGARSEVKPVWRISLRTNVNLVLVVLASFAFQVWIQHSTTLGGFFKTSLVPLAESVEMLVLAAVPLAVLEIVKVLRLTRTHRQQHPSAAATP